MQHFMALSIFTRSERTCRAQLVGVATVAVLATLPLAAAFSAIRNVEIIHKTVGQVGRVHLLPARTRAADGLTSPLRNIICANFESYAGPGEFSIPLSYVFLLA